MKKLIKTTLIGMSMFAVSSAFAGMTITSSDPTVSGSTVSVDCGYGKVPAIVDQDVSFSVIKLVFLGGQDNGNCVFTRNDDGSTVGSGTITINSNGTATVVAKNGTDDVSVSGNNTSEVIINVSKPTTV